MAVCLLFRFDDDDEIKGMDHFEGCFETREKAKSYAIEFLEERFKERLEDLSPSRKAYYGEELGKIYTSTEYGIEGIGINGLYLYLLLLEVEVQYYPQFLQRRKQ